LSTDVNDNFPLSKREFRNSTTDEEQPNIGLNLKWNNFF